MPPFSQVALSHALLDEREVVVVSYNTCLSRTLDVQTYFSAILSFGCRIPINNSKDNNNGKASCSRKNTTKKNRETKHWMRREGRKGESNMNTHLSEN